MNRFLGSLLRPNFCTQIVLVSQRQQQQIGSKIFWIQFVDPPTPDPPLLVRHESRRFGRRYRKWHHWPNDFLPFQWERPPLDPPYLRSGDAVRDIGEWNPATPIPGAENSRLLKTAPEPVRRIFSLEFAERSQVVESQRRRIVDAIRRHPFDELSPEVRIAQYTIRIRNNLNHFIKIDKYDAPRKIRQDIAIKRRDMLLKDLYYQDRERFDYVTRLLGIKYSPPKLGVLYQKPTRKSELRRLTTEYCEQIREQRLNKYHAELRESRQTTLAQDEEALAKMLAEDEKYLGTQNPTNSNQQSSNN